MGAAATKPWRSQELSSSDAKLRCFTSLTEHEGVPVHKRASADELEALGARLEETNSREFSISPVVLKVEHVLESPGVSHSVGLGWGPRSAFLTHFQTVMRGPEPDVEDH